MEETKKPDRKHAAERAAQRKREEVGPVLASPRAHLIRIPDKQARQRAILALGEVREPYCGFTDYRMLVTNEHLEVLRREDISFEVVS